MAFDAHVLQILIASPGDAIAARDAAERALHGWNADRAVREQVILLPRRWETSAVPVLGGRAQGVINGQLVDNCDVVVALFDSRLGMETGEAVSGTAEEIQRAHHAGKPVHVWFSDEQLSRDVDLNQLAALRGFQATLEPMGLLGTYVSPDDLAFKVRQAVEHDLTQLDLGPVESRRPRDGARLRVKFESEREPTTDSRGKVRYRTRGERIVVRNDGSRSAENVALSLEALGETDAPSVWQNETPSIPDGGEYSWRVMPSQGDAYTVIVVLTWQEDGIERSERQQLSLL